MYHADAYWRKRKKRKQRRISRVTTRPAWIVHTVIISLCLFSIITQPIAFIMGRASVTLLCSCPSCLFVCRLRLRLGYNKSNQFFILTYLRSPFFPDYQVSGTWLVSARDLRHLPHQWVILSGLPTVKNR